ncbi:MAG: hypothetical protein SFU83_22400 [Meiothermus sp.]|nr:hypothetical protein [Meiothermus sp.]
MRFIPTLAHGVVDYGAGLILELSPSIFGFNYGGAETWVPHIAFGRFGVGATRTSRTDP